jgi:DNA (cytosine-5)-methyltransferase 1
MNNHPPSLQIGSLCSGYRGLDTAVEEIFGGTTAWVSDVDPGANKILAHRWPTTPNIGDLTTTRWEDVEPVDIVCGGYPCQPFSTAGKRKGTADARHLWPFIAGALRVLRPRVAIFENVANHLRIGFDTVLADLAEIGFDAEWCLVRADEVGAPHPRKRLFLLATAADAADLGHERSRAARGRGHGSTNHRQPATHAERLVPGHNGELPAGRDAVQRGVRHDASRCGTTPAADTNASGRGAEQYDLRPGQPNSDWGRFAPAIARWEAATGRSAPWATDDHGRLSPWFVEWMMGLPAGHVTGVPGLTRTAQLKALGNGVVPQQAAAAIRLLHARAIDGAVAA